MISYLIPLKITTICVKIKFMTWLPKQKLLKRLSKNNSILLKNHCQHFKPIGTTSNKEVTEILQEQNKLLIKWNKSETKIIEMLVESQNKSRNDQKSTEKFEVVKQKILQTKKYWKWTNKLPEQIWDLLYRSQWWGVRKPIRQLH